MNEKDMLATLHAVSFLRGVDKSFLEQLAELGKLVDFPQGSIIFREGDSASNVFLIVAGNVSLEICAPGVGCRRILTIGEGELLGWSPALGQSRLTATARTLNATRAFD